MMRACIFFLTGVAAVFGQSEYFPLHVGNQWVYKITGFAPGDPVVVEVTGIRTEGGRTYAVVRGFEDGEVLLRHGDDGKTYRYDAAVGRESLWADFATPAGGSYETSINPCNKMARVMSRSATVKVPAGEFGNALAISYPAANCADAGLTDEVYLPYIGLIKRTANTIGGPRSLELSYARIGGVTVLSEPDAAFTLTLDAAVYKPGAKIVARLTLRTPQPVELEFGSGQRFDFAIRNEKGDEGYRWSATRTFIAVFGAERFGPGEKNWALTAPLPAGLAPGQYVAEGFLTSLGGKRYSATVGFTITP